MKNIITIAKKEFKDTLRDRRTLLVMIVVPLLLFPVLFSFVGNIQSSSMKEAAERKLNIGYNKVAGNETLLNYLEKNENFALIELQQTDSLSGIIKEDTLHAVLIFPSAFDSMIDSMKETSVAFYFESTEEQVEERIVGLIRQYEDEIVNERLSKLEINKSVIDPVIIKRNDVSTTQEKIGKIAGGLIPYVFIIFCFIGAMYPAIDLFTGEKERQTIETILTTPVHRMEILTGKMLVIILAGIFSALLAIVGLFFGLNSAEALPSQLTEVVTDMLSANTILLLLSMLIPLTIFFAGILIPITVYAKSFKEAQSIITPLNIIIILPAIIGMLPGIELNIKTAVIPVINIALATKEIVAGTIDFSLLAIVYASLIVFAVAAISFSVRYFSKETNILRS
jgi:sodium transport system permease protein